MDKTIEIVVVAMVILVAATILLFLFQDRTDSFGNFLDSQQSGAQCELLKAQEKCQQFSQKGCSGTCETPSQSSGGSSVPDCQEGYRPASGGGCVPEGSSSGF